MLEGPCDWQWKLHEARSFRGSNDWPVMQYNTTSLELLPVRQVTNGSAAVGIIQFSIIPFIQISRIKQPNG